MHFRGPNYLPANEVLKYVAMQGRVQKGKIGPACENEGPPDKKETPPPKKARRPTTKI